MALVVIVSPAEPFELARGTKVAVAVARVSVGVSVVVPATPFGFPRTKVTVALVAVSVSAVVPAAVP
jgi:hypothetical protein